MDHKHWLKQYHQSHEVSLPVKKNNDNIFFLEQRVKNLTMPSRSMVARTCSEPGVTVNVDLALMPLSIAC